MPASRQCSNEKGTGIKTTVNFAGCSASSPGSGNFILSNRNGSFALFRPFPLSRYDGLFAMQDVGEVCRFVESLEHEEPVLEVINHLCRVERKRKSFTETFSMPEGIGALNYAASKEVSLRLVLDCKHAYDNSEWGRNYCIDPLPQGVLISYSKKHDPREASGFGEYSLFTAVHCPNGSFQPNPQWIDRDYSEDTCRNSPPFKRYVYSAGIIKARSFVIGTGFSRASAIAAALRAWEMRSTTADVCLSRIIKFKSVMPNFPIVPKLSITCLCAAEALDSLVVDNKGIYAGLPWFFQFWARDSAVASKALSMIGRKDIAKNILMKQVSGIVEGIQLPNLFAAKTNSYSLIPSLDGILWTYLRLGELLEKLPESLTPAERKVLASKLQATLSHIQSITEDGLVRNGPKETWMDTEFGGDTRSGFRIETQCLVIAAIRLAKLLNIPCLAIKPRLAKIKKAFWNGSYLNDGKDDPTIRPNIFIAAYVCPELLPKKEWMRCFDAALPKLWLGWGGISSIAKDSPLFTSESTGEDVRSYHRGDSWFWINAMAAIVLHRTDPDHYKKYIDPILEASTKEILFLGATGHHAEVSSASHLSSKGCLSQAWSAAMYLELIDEICRG